MQPEIPEVTAVVTLSDEQLAYLIDRAGLSSIPGFAVPEDFDDRQRDAAERALIAQGIMERGSEGELTINAGVAEIVTASGRAGRLLRIARGDDAHWFHIVAGYAVHLHAPQPGIQRFQVLDNGVKVAAVLMFLLGIEDPQRPAPAGTQTLLPKALYHQARAQATSGSEAQAVSTLTAAGLSRAGAEALARPEPPVVISGAQVEGDQFIAEQAFALYRDDAGGLWGTFAAPQDTMRVTPLSGEAALESILDLQ